MNTPKGYISQETARKLFKALRFIIYAVRVGVPMEYDSQAWADGKDAVTKAEEELNG